MEKVIHVLTIIANIVTAIIAGLKQLGELNRKEDSNVVEKSNQREDSE